MWAGPNIINYVNLKRKSMTWEGRRVGCDRNAKHESVLGVFSSRCPKLNNKTGNPRRVVSLPEGITLRRK